MSAGDDRASRVRMSRAEGHALVTDWEASGLGPTAFCRSRGITVNRLSYWRSQVAPVGFLEAVVEAAPVCASEPVTTEAIEVVVGHIVVRVPDRPGRAAEILAALGKSTP